MNMYFTKEHPHIQKIRSVTRNSMGKGHYPKRTRGRYSDCLVYVISGEAVYKFDGYTIIAETDGVLYLPYDSYYTIDVISADYDVLFIDYDFVYQNDERYRCEVFKSIGIQTKNRFENIYRIWLQKKPNYQERSLAVIYNIIADAISQKTSEYYSSKSYQVIYEAVNYINENYCNKGLKIEDAAQLSGISRVHFGRLFTKLYKVSPKRYLELLRFERVKELMQNDELTLERISAMCGYTDVYYFNKSFKKEFGVTPGEYRRELSM